MIAIPDRPKYLLVGNPTAQSGKARQWIERALEVMAEREMLAEFMQTEPEGRTVELLRRRLDAADADVVISLGGDGTFHEIATGILKARRPRPMGMIPSGTANDQGHSFGIKRGDIERNLSIVQAGHITHLDVGRIEKLDHDGEVVKTSYFYDSCGFGINPDILATRNRHRAVVQKVPGLRTVYRDQAVYVGASVGKLLESYFTPVKFAADIVADGTMHHLKGLTDVIICGTPVYAGAWVIDRRAEPDDGLFELAPMQGRRDWASKTLRDLWRSPVWQEQLDKLGLEHSENLQARRYDIDLFRPGNIDIHAQVDGEEWGVGDRFRVTVLPNLLPLITPEGFVPPWRPPDGAAPAG